MIEKGRTDIEDVESERRLSTATNSEITACLNECIFSYRFFIFIPIFHRATFMLFGTFKEDLSKRRYYLDDDVKAATQE